MRYPWPGNVRELSNLTAYVLAMAEEDEVNASDLPPKFREKAYHSSPESTDQNNIVSGEKFYDQIASYEKKLLAAAYEKHSSNVSKTALALGMDRSHLHSKLKEYGIYSKR